MFRLNGWRETTREFKQTSFDCFKWNIHVVVRSDVENIINLNIER